jgi:hypothetical protein
MKQQSLFKRVGRFLFIILAALWMMFEEWVWDTILAVMEKIGRLKMVNRFESFLARQNQYLLLTLFSFPFLIMLPAKLYGVYLIADGRIVRGVAVIIVAKGFITALVTRLFVISKNKLLQINAFAAMYYWFKDKKEWLYAELNKLPGWQAAKRKITELKHRIRLKIRSLRVS